MILKKLGMTKNDIPFFRTLIKSSPEWEVSECSAESLENYLNSYEEMNGIWSVWYAAETKIAISYSVEQAPSNGRPWIGTLIIEPTFRQKGWGKKIVRKLTSDFQNNGHQIVYAAVPLHQNDWISFLSSCGFEQYKLEKEKNNTYLLFVKPLEKE